MVERHAVIFITLPSNNRQIGLRFEHQHVTNNKEWWIKPNPKYQGTYAAAADKRTTICQIRDASKNPATPITQATVVWNPLDRFSKLDGQKRALTMALNYLLGLGVCSKADRATIWEAFWDARRPQLQQQGVTTLVEGIVVPEGAGAVTGVS